MAKFTVWNLDSRSLPFWLAYFQNSMHKVQTMQNWSSCIYVAFMGKLGMYECTSYRFVHVWSPTNTANHGGVCTCCCKYYKIRFLRFASFNDILYLTSKTCCDTRLTCVRVSARFLSKRVMLWSKREKTGLLSISPPKRRSNTSIEQQRENRCLDFLRLRVQNKAAKLNSKQCTYATRAGNNKLQRNSKQLYQYGYYDYSIPCVHRQKDSLP